MAEHIPISSLLSLSGKTAVVTGGAMGIGLGIVTRFVEAGAAVMVADLSDPDAKKSSDDLNSKGFKTSYVAVDVSNEEQVKTMVNKTVSEFGSLDILVNNAGIYPSVAFANMTLAEFEKVIDVNLKGVFLCTKYASEQMIKQGRGGKVINVTSIDALHPSSIGLAHYDSSKHGVWGFTKNVALELSGHKIWVNAIAPGGIATPGVEKATSGATSGVDMNEMIDAFLAKIPMHRMGDPDDIGKVALFLASDMSSYMTGAQIVVDGGVLLS